jgi:hypothetical protein
VAIDNGERALRKPSATLLILPLLLLTEQRQKMIAPKSFLIAGRQIGDSHRKDRAARKLPASPLILVQSDNHREAPWLVMKCAREFWFD